MRGKKIVCAYNMMKWTKINTNMRIYDLVIPKMWDSNSWITRP